MNSATVGLFASGTFSMSDGGCMTQWYAFDSFRLHNPLIINQLSHIWRSLISNLAHYAFRSDCNQAEKVENMEEVELVFKDGLGPDPAKLIQSATEWLACGEHPKGARLESGLPVMKLVLHSGRTYHGRHSSDSDLVTDPHFWFGH